MKTKKTSTMTTEGMADGNIALVKHSIQVSKPKSVTKVFTTALALALTAFAVMGQADTTKIITGSLPDNIVQDNGKYNKAGQKTGTWIEYFDSGINTGKIKSKTKYKKGLKNGKCIKYYDTGDKIIVKWKGNYKQDNLNGTIKSYTESGFMIKKAKYKNGKCIRLTTANFI